MKKLMVTVAAVAALTGLAADASKDAKESKEIVKQEAPLFWGFGNTGIYSGYQLYGSLVNSEPTWQTYVEGNLNLSIKGFDLGYLGIGIWNNCDLTRKRHDSYEQMFNEQDYNIHWGRTFWIDDDKTWGIGYRTSVVWYYYPHHGNRYEPTATTMDWNHYFEIVNPYVIPYINVVHEYHESDGNLLQFGLKKTIAVNDELSLSPCLEFVWRNSHYNWCFPTAGFTEFHGQGLATGKIGLDANYQITSWMGVFAKVAFCTTLDSDLRDASDHTSGAGYGKYKDFAWGGVGLSFNF